MGGQGPEPAVIRLRDARVEGLLGHAVPRERSAQILTRLGFGVAEESDGLDVIVPHFRRFDVTREADVIEEVARIDGLEKLPATIQRNRTGKAGRLTTTQRLRRRAEDVLIGAGLYEVAGWSFTSYELLDSLRVPEGDPMRRVVEIENPMSEVHSILRPTLLGSLLDVAAHNRDRGAEDLAIFEAGTVYRKGDGPLASEHQALGVLLRGRATPASWNGAQPKPADAFAAKGLLEAVFSALRVELAVEPVHDRSYLHPGRSAVVLAAGETVGFVGEIHPLVAAAWDFHEPLAVFVFDLDRVLPLAPEWTHYRDFTSFPPVRQDLAVIVDEDVPAAQVLSVVRGAGREALARADVFDVYHGDQVGAGRKSLALHLVFEASDRTLSDEDVAPVRERIVAALRDELDGELRG